MTDLIEMVMSYLLRITPGVTLLVAIAALLPRELRLLRAVLQAQALQDEAVPEGPLLQDPVLRARLLRARVL